MFRNKIRPPLKPYPGICVIKIRDKPGKGLIFARIIFDMKIRPKPGNGLILARIIFDIKIRPKPGTGLNIARIFS